jgi:FixJ family two-component response regulator
MDKRAEQTIYLVDDDESVRKAFSILLLSAGYKITTFRNAETFFEAENITAPGCIILDIFLENESGLDLQDIFKSRFKSLPIIYMSGQGDIPMTVRALRNGAINFLQKPVDDKHLLESVNEALTESVRLVEEQTERNRIKLLAESLTSREFEIFRMVIKGKLNKQIASDLNIAEHTVKLHRGRITEKLGVKSVPEMVHMAEKLNII